MNNITSISLYDLQKVMESQDEKGMKKYGTPLNYLDDYNWDIMADEELADLIKYRMCRKLQIIDLKQKLINALADEDIHSVHKTIREIVDKL